MHGREGGALTGPRVNTKARQAKARAGAEQGVRMGRGGGTARAGHGQQGGGTGAGRGKHLDIRQHPEGHRNVGGEEIVAQPQRQYAHRQAPHRPIIPVRYLQAEDVDVQAPGIQQPYGEK